MTGETAFRYLSSLALSTGNPWCKTVAMGYPYAHLLLRAYGVFGSSTSPSDKWSVGFRIGDTNADIIYNAALLQTFVNTAGTILQTIHQAPSMKTGTNCWITHATVARVGAGLGRYDPDDQDTLFSGDLTGAGNGSPVHPFNTAGVISLRTGRPRGYASNGRIYWPWLAATVATATGRVSPTDVQARVDTFATQMTALNTAAAAYAASANLIVASNVGSGRHETVTHIRADGRLDSIERRENQLDPVYASANIS